MADDIQLSSNIGVGDKCAADEIGGIKFQRVKLIHGAVAGDMMLCIKNRYT